MLFLLGWRVRGRLMGLGMVFSGVRMYVCMYIYIYWLRGRVVRVWGLLVGMGWYKTNVRCATWM